VTIKFSGCIQTSTEHFVQVTARRYHHNNPTRVHPSHLVKRMFPLNPSFHIFYYTSSLLLMYETPCKAALLTLMPQPLKPVGYKISVHVLQHSYFSENRLVVAHDWMKESSGRERSNMGIIRLGCIECWNDVIRKVKTTRGRYMMRDVGTWWLTD